jgi:hypothetical protein
MCTGPMRILLVSDTEARSGCLFVCGPSHHISILNSCFPFHADSNNRSISTESSLREQLRHLNEKYDTLKNVKERAAERYDFKKWRTFNDWLFAAEDTKHNKYRNEPGITPKEKKQLVLCAKSR